MIENLENETWKDIEDYEGMYQVSNLGRVKSLPRQTKLSFRKGKILKLSSDKNGYELINLSTNGFQKTYKVHRLVANAFIPNPKNNPQVNHKDFNKKNNDISNLEWLNSRDNTVHYNNTKVKSSQYVGVTFSKQQQKWFAAIYFNGKRSHLGRFENEIKAAEAYKNALLNFTK